MPTPKQIDSLFKENVNIARLMFAAHVSSTTEWFPYHAAVIYKDRDGEVLVCVNFSMPKHDELASFDFEAKSLSGVPLAKGTGCAEWAKYLQENNWLARWVSV